MMYNEDEWSFEEKTKPKEGIARRNKLPTCFTGKEDNWRDHLARINVPRASLPLEKPKGGVARGCGEREFATPESLRKDSK